MLDARLGTAQMTYAMVPPDAHLLTPNATSSVARMPITANARRLNCTANNVGIFAAEWS